MTEHRTARLVDVARSAEVSLATASRVLSNRGEFSVETRTRVLRAAAELSYERSSTSRGRPTSVDPRAIEFVCGLFGDYWADETTTGARHAALSGGSDLVMTMERNRVEDDWPVRVSTRRSSGVVLAIITPTVAQMDAMRNLNIPIVLLEPPAEPPDGISSVSAAAWQGGYDAGAHLVERGYERFAIVRAEPRLRFGRARDDGFRAAIAELASTPEVDVLQGDWSGGGIAERAARELFERPGRLGVFAYNDALALAVCALAGRLDVRVPQDLGVVGVDGDLRGAAAHPSLTTVTQPLRRMAMRAVELIFQQREHPALEPAREVLPTELTVRGSTGG
jgi:DNA-binding LacI/PurR family transcriptional regulator